jgi:hypothetical protein
LLLHRATDVYPALRSIVVYPRPYLAPTAWDEGFGLVTEEREVRLGESWSYGTVVLSWRDVRRAARGGSGFNVVLHELAHQLDDEDGEADGVPLLPRREMYEAWQRELGREYRALRAELEGDYDGLIDPYAATAPAEFFAVVTELFFEQPTHLRREHPRLYEQFRAFYAQDPAALEAAPEG